MDSKHGRKKEICKRRRKNTRVPQVTLWLKRPWVNKKMPIRGAPLLFGNVGYTRYGNNFFARIKLFILKKGKLVPKGYMAHLPHLLSLSIWAPILLFRRYELASGNISSNNISELKSNLTNMTPRNYRAQVKGNPLS